ncbi:hypothetical protein OROMI_017771 [Orobanche minor]
MNKRKLYKGKEENMNMDIKENVIAARNYLKLVKADGVVHMHTEPCLGFCTRIALLIGMMDGIFMLVALDIKGNVTRLDKKHLSNKHMFKYLHTLVQDEIGKNPTKDKTSCTLGLLWLTRNLENLSEWNEAGVRRA